MPSSQAKQSLADYHASHDRCGICYAKENPARGQLGRLELHHICGRGREEHHCEKNYLLVCNECHNSIHSVATGRSLELGHVLTAKEEEDNCVDLVFLAGLRNRTCLRQDPMPLPEWVEIERVDNGHGWWNQY